MYEKYKVIRPRIPQRDGEILPCPCLRTHGCYVFGSLVEADKHASVYDGTALFLCLWGDTRDFYLVMRPWRWRLPPRTPSSISQAPDRPIWMPDLLTADAISQQRNSRSSTWIWSTSLTRLAALPALHIGESVTRTRYCDVYERRTMRLDTATDPSASYQP